LRGDDQVAVREESQSQRLKAHCIYYDVMRRLKASPDTNLNPQFNFDAQIQLLNY